MIGWLKGHMIDFPQPGKIVLDVNGVGYDIEVSLTTFFQVELIKTETAFYIQTIVREDAFLLYGFIHREERSLFRELIKVNGVGPKMAIAILSGTTPQEFIHNIQQENTGFLTKIPGIGKKTAERLIVEMRDPLSQLQMSLSEPHTLKLNIQNEAMSALEALGYKKQEATKVIQQIDDGQKSVEQLIRQALQSLVKSTC